MAKKEKMCPQPETKVGWVSKEKKGSYLKRAYCPTCKRHLETYLELCHDGCCFSVMIPPHKRKGWWKRGKKQSKRGK